MLVTFLMVEIVLQVDSKCTFIEKHTSAKAKKDFNVFFLNIFGSKPQDVLKMFFFSCIHKNKKNI